MSFYVWCLTDVYYPHTCDPHHGISRRISGHIYWHLTCHCIWHLFRHRFWHSICITCWHSIEHIFWHSIGHIFWHSIRTGILAFYFKFVLTFYLAYILTFCMAFVFIFQLRCIKSVYLAHILAFFSWLPICIYSGILSDILSKLLSEMLSGSLFDITFYLTHILTFCLRYWSAHCDRDFTGWGPSVPTAIVTSPVEVRQCILRSCTKPLRSGDARCHPARAVDVRRCPLCFMCFNVAVLIGVVVTCGYPISI